MSDLPDLNTSDIGFIAYYQAIDQAGLSDISPEDVTSLGSINSTTLYDNGVDGELTSVTGRPINFRVKNDGWIVTWFGRDESYALSDEQMQSDPDTLRGHWDVVNNWTGRANSPNIQKNTLERAVNSLYSELSNSGNGTYNVSDVGLYNYEYSAASNLTALGSKDTRDGGSGTITKGFSYTDTTDIRYHALCASGEPDDWAGGPAYGKIVFEGYKVMDTDQGSQGNTQHHVIDVKSRGLAPNANTEYTSDWTTSGDDGRSNYQGASHVAMWV